MLAIISICFLLISLALGYVIFHSGQPLGWYWHTGLIGCVLGFVVSLAWHLAADALRATDRLARRETKRRLEEDDAAK